MALLPSAAATAAAQVRVGIAVEAAVRPVQVGVMGRSGEMNSLPLMNSPLSLNPSLSAPLAPVPNSVVLPRLHSQSVAVQSSLPLALTASAIPAASKADDVRREAAKAVSDWKSSRYVEKSAAAVTPAPADVTKLDALFDGSLPTSNEVLTRAKSLGLSDTVLAQTLADSQSPTDAAARLSHLGILGPKESALATGAEEAVFRFLLTRVWRKTAPSIPASAAVDKSFPVPALKVERNGITYFVHAVAHGQLGAPRRASVLALVRKLAAEGRSLYSEQNLPAYYGYKSGRETLDHAVAADGSVKIVPAAPGFDSLTLGVKRALEWLVSPGSALGALAWVVASPASVFAWILLPLLVGLAAYTLTGGLPYMAWKRRRLAAGARADGLDDIAEQYADEARNFFTAKPDLETLRGMELPQPLGATDDLLSLRSRAIADAVAKDAAATGAATAHLIVGHLHAHEVAARLASGPTAPVPGSQIS